MFSPYYARARRRNPLCNPADHCAVNIALYGPGRYKRWAMTERGQQRLQRDADCLRIGPSQLSWHRDALTIEVNERSVPFPSALRGTIRVHPRALAAHVTPLDDRGQHRWRPIAPCAQVEVCLSSPALRWAGRGYFDSNSGDAPIEDAISTWDWSRTSLRDGTAVIYDVAPRHSKPTSLALHFDRHAEAQPFEAPATVALPTTGWRIKRHTRAEHGDAQVIRTFEDTPFYARSELHSRLAGQSTLGVHESLNLDRFRSPIVQAMLPFRMPRVAGAA